MNHVIASQVDAINASFDDSASPADKRAGVAACRTLLALLESQPGLPLDTSRGTAVAPLASALGQLGQLNVDQVLDLVILKLRTMVPADGAAGAARPGFQLPALMLPGGGAR